MRNVLSGTAETSYREPKGGLTGCDSKRIKKRENGPLNSINIYNYLYLYTRRAYTRIPYKTAKINQYLYAWLRSFAPEYYHASLAVSGAAGRWHDAVLSVVRPRGVVCRDVWQRALKPSPGSVVVLRPPYRGTRS